MTIRAIATPAAAIAVAALLVTMLVTASDPGQPAERTAADVPGASSTSGQSDDAASGPAQRLAKRVLDNGCSYSERGIPSCGTLLGAAYGGNTDPVGWENQMRHRLGVHRTYFADHEVGEAVDQARDDLLHQRIPWISFKLPHSWGAMAAGEGDDWTRDLSERLARLPGPVWLAFHHEPENDGNIADWTAMQERLAPIVRRTAPNVAFSVILTGWHQFYGPRQYRLDSLWPDTKIDLVGFDIYNAYGTMRRGSRVVVPTQFVDRYFVRIEQFAREHGVAWGLAETGQTDLSADQEPLFVQLLYDDVSSYGGVAVSYFNSTMNATAPWRLSGSKDAQFAATLRETPTL